ncbi:MAG: hypothetical protein R3F20_10525 [Planctomycetota bacterium]
MGARHDRLAVAASAALLGLALSLVGCGTGPEGGESTEETAMEETGPTTAELYARRCSACHLAYEPGAFSDERWREILPTMAPMAQIDADEEARILAWLLASN